MKIAISHNRIKSHIVGARLSVPNFRLLENGKPNRMTWISGAALSIL
jgi:hypothetical protein